MGQFIMKASKTEDLYVEWSSVCDAPTRYGPAETIHTLTADRKARADETGTSALDSDYGGWDSKGMIVHNMGTKGGFYWLERDKLYDFIAALGTTPEDREVQQAALDKHTEDITDED